MNDRRMHVSLASIDLFDVFAHSVVLSTVVHLAQSTRRACMDQRIIMNISANYQLKLILTNFEGLPLSTPRKASDPDTRVWCTLDLDNDVKEEKKILKVQRLFWAL
jgi:hypothetical protein